MLSNVGYGVTRLFETAFSTPAMTDHGFADALQTLMTVRKSALSRIALGSANSPTDGADVERSFVNYVADCTLYDVDIGTRSIEDILKTPSWTTLQSALDVPTTELWLGGSPRTLACDAAWTQLQDYTTTQFAPALLKNLQAALRLAGPGDVQTKVQFALDQIAGGAVDAQNYMVMAAVVPFFEKGVIQAHEDLHHWELAAMVEQSVAQQNAQWAAEQSLFSRKVRPMLTFFEGFLYAIAPLMAFAVALGPVGIAMVGKYLLIALWIQLWLPVMAVINLYLHMAIAGEFDALRTVQGLELPAMYALFKSDLLLQDYLATGGLLAASTPAISLMLIYGTSIAATHLAGRLQGRDHIAERAVAPDVASPAGALAVKPLQERAPFTGTVATDADSLLPTFRVGAESEQRVSSSYAAAQRAGTEFISALGSAATRSAAERGESAERWAINWQHGATTSATTSTLRQHAEDLQRQFAQSGVTTDEMAGLLTVGIGATGAGRDHRSVADAIRGAFEGRAQGRHIVQDGLSDKITEAVTNKVTADQGFRADLARGIRQDISEGHSNAFTEGLSLDQKSDLAQRATDTVTASTEYSNAVSLAQRVGAGAEFRATRVAHALAQERPDLLTRMHQAVDRLNLTGDLQQAASEWTYSRAFPTRTQAEAAAGMALLFGMADQPTYQRLSPQEKQAAWDAALDILGAAFGVTDRGDTDAHRHAALSTGAPTPGMARAAVDAGGLQDPRAAATAVPARVEAAQGTLGERALDASRVTEAAERHRESVAIAASQSTTESRGTRAAWLADTIRERATLPRPVPQLIAEETGGLAKKVLASGTLAAEGASGAMSRFVDTLAQTGSVTEAVQATGEGWQEARQAMIDTRLRQVENTGLTEPQRALFAAALERAVLLPGGMEKALDTDYAQTRAALLAAEGPMGEPIAELLERAAASTQDTDLRLIGRYNAARALADTDDAGLAPLSPPALSQGNVTGGRAGAVLDLIAAAESRGNYNAWHGNAAQRDFDLSALSVNEVRALQAELIRSTGGSAIGRYQILDDTLGSLATRLGLSGDERFTPALQDRLALQLARDAGLDRWLEGRLSDDQFRRNLSLIWAGLPLDASNRSAYEGVAGNRAQLSHEAVTAWLRTIRQQG
jgi:conjugal transfer mating pair stabilization protein TraG